MQFFFNFDDFDDIEIQSEITESAETAIESLNELASILEQHSEFKSAAAVRQRVREVRAIVGSVCDKLTE